MSVAMGVLMDCAHRNVHARMRRTALEHLCRREALHRQRECEPADPQGAQPGVHGVSLFESVRPWHARAYSIFWT
jgi:hypothetical protein